MNLDIDLDDIPAEMTRADVCRLLDISGQTLERWILTGRISKGRKVFHNRVFSKAEILKAIHKSKIK